MEVRAAASAGYDIIDVEGKIVGHADTLTKAVALSRQMKYGGDEVTKGRKEREYAKNDDAK